MQARPTGCQHIQLQIVTDMQGCPRLDGPGGPRPAPRPAGSRKALTRSNARANSRSTATRSKAGSARARGSHKVADAR